MMRSSFPSTIEPVSIEHTANDAPRIRFIAGLLDSYRIPMAG